MTHLKIRGFLNSGGSELNVKVGQFYLTINSKVIVICQKDRTVETIIYCPEN